MPHLIEAMGGVLLTSVPLEFEAWATWKLYTTLVFLA